MSEQHPHWPAPVAARHTGPGPVVTTNPAAGLPHDLLAELREAREHLHHIISGLEALRRREPKLLPAVTFSATETRIRREGYAHVRVFLNAAATLVVDAGIGPANTALTQGWTVVDWPEGTTVTAATNTNALIELTDEPVGNAWHA